MIHQNSPTDRPPRRHVSQVQRLDLSRLKRVFKSPGTVHTITWDHHPVYRHLPLHLAVVADDSGQPLGLIFHHRSMDSFEWITYRINLDASPCNLGGRRHWFRCPGPSDDIQCGSRRRVLFQRDGSHQFACAECARVHYRNPMSGLAERAMAVLLDAAGTPEGRDWLTEASRGSRRSRRK